MSLKLKKIEDLVRSVEFLTSVSSDSSSYEDENELDFKNRLNSISQSSQIQENDEEKEEQPNHNEENGDFEAGGNDGGTRRTRFDSTGTTDSMEAAYKKLNNGKRVRFSTQIDTTIVFDETEDVEKEKNNPKIRSVYNRVKSMKTIRSLLDKFKNNNRQY